MVREQKPIRIHLGRQSFHILFASGERAGKFATFDWMLNTE